MMGTLIRTIETARRVARAGDFELIICRGPEKGCTRPGRPCHDCYRVDASDARTAEEILRDMERGDA